MITIDELLDNEQTAALLGIKPNTLEIWRYKGKGPVFLKLGDTPQAPVRYLRSEVTEWLARRSFSSTSAFTEVVRAIGAESKQLSGPSQKPCGVEKVDDAAFLDRIAIIPGGARHG